MAVNKVVYNGNTLIDLTNDTVAADKMLSGTTAHDKSGAAVSGSMANNGAMNKTMDGVNTKSVSIPDGYTSGGTVSMDSTIDNAVTAAITALTDKGVTVPDGTDVTGLADLIAAIEAGGGGDYKIIKGSFTPASASAWVSTPIEVSGLGFKPEIVCILASDKVVSSSASVRSVSAAISTPQVKMFNEIYHSSSDCKVYYLGNMDEEYFLITHTDDGFEMSGGSVYYYALTTTYHYVAIA